MKQCVGDCVARSINARDVIRTLVLAIGDNGSEVYLKRFFAN
jgi:hypothetical protein